MRPFKFTHAADAAKASQSIAANRDAFFIAGGTNLLDLMKEGVERPSELVDISRLSLTQIKSAGQMISIGALAKNTETANHPLIRQNFPLLTQAILAGASPQIRNMATNGGNLMQRTRCSYFYDVSMPCNKREPGSGCGAMEGINKGHAILGWSDKCIATNPSDMSVALLALDAVVKVSGANGKQRSIPFGDFHRLPGDSPEKDNTLERGEIITSIEIPTASSAFAPNSYYLKIRDRSSYAFALVSVAAAFEVKGGLIQKARVALGGVAHKPWRATAAEAAMQGQKVNGSGVEDAFRSAAEAELKAAKPLEHNSYKVELAKRAMTLAFRKALKIEVAT
ncbi:MAG: xanthine dehydrogenase family protein subunit M [Pyrinomonadaceae bacterium]